MLYWLFICVSMFYPPHKLLLVVITLYIIRNYYVFLTSYFVFSPYTTVAR